MAFPPGTLLTFQLTVVVAVPATVDVNCCVPPTEIPGVAGRTVTVIAGGVIMTVTDADLLGSAAFVAVTVTAFGLGTELGAV